MTTWTKLPVRVRVAKALRRLVTARAESSDAGETLVEVLIAIIVLGLASVALITAFGTDILASTEHRSLANFDTALASSISMTTSLVQQQDVGVFATCPVSPGSLASYPSPAVLTSALNITGFTAAIAGVGNQPAVEFSQGGVFSPTCSSQNVGNPQLINVVVTDTRRHYSQSNTVVVVDPAPAQTAGGVGTSATQLVFETQPEGATVGTPFTTQPRLEVLDANGKIVTNDLSPITLTITPNSGTNGAALSSTCSGVETSGVVVYSRCSINEVGAGYTLSASEPSPSGSGELSSTSAPFTVYATQLATPTITQVTPSSVTAGALNVTFNVPANPPAGETYTAKACTDAAMSVNCSTPTGITSGSDLTGLVPGISYYVEVTASSTSTSYLNATSPPSGPTMATLQLGAPGTPVLGYGTVAGPLSVTFSGSLHAVAGQTYTVAACTNNNMNSGCVTNINVTSGATLTGLTFVPGSLVTPYFVQVSANASPGYLTSAPSPTTPTVSHDATSQVKTPTGFSAAPSASQTGALTASFTEPGGGTAPSSFTATVCTDPAMSVGCVAVANYVSGTQVTGLTPGSSYYVEITAVASTTGYVSATTGVSAATIATAQLTAPTGVTLGYGTVAGSLSVTFTPPPVAASAQTYTAKACTNATMTNGCVTNSNFTSGTNLTGLAYNTGFAGGTYWVQVTANASSGYLVSPATAAVSHADASQIGAPGTPTGTTSTTPGAIVVTFANATGTAPSSYSAMACTDQGMSLGCVPVTNFTSGAQLGGLTSNQRYYVQITAIGPVGLVNSTSAVSTNSVKAR